MVAGVGIPVVLGLLSVGGLVLAVPVAALAALAAREFYALAQRGGERPLQALGMTTSAWLVLLAAWRPSFSGFAPPALAVLCLAAAGGLAASIKVRGPDGRPLEAVASTLLGSLYTGVPMAFVPLLHALPARSGWGGGAGDAWEGLAMVALPLSATWVGDTTALFAGSAWGRGGLAPSVSPNKSWVGVWGGLAGAGVAGVVWYVATRGVLPGLPVAGPLVALGMGVVLGAVAVLGDLVESLLKREAGVKDSGALFPGHGGVLDRLDALVFTLPAAYVALAALEAGT